jgi:large subunit ribosomal protein L16
VVKAGRILFELAGVGEKTAKEAIRLASHKLPIATRFVVRETGVVLSYGEKGVAKVES